MTENSWPRKRYNTSIHLWVVNLVVAKREKMKKRMITREIGADGTREICVPNIPVVLTQLHLLCADLKRHPSSVQMRWTERIRNKNFMYRARGRLSVLGTMDRERERDGGRDRGTRKRQVTNLGCWERAVLVSVNIGTSRGITAAVS